MSNKEAISFKVIPFTIFDKDSLQINEGVLTQAENGHASITLKRTIGDSGFVIDVNEKRNIEDAGNFLCAIIKRYDKKNNAKSIHVSGKDYAILEEEKKTELLYVINGNTFALDALLSVKGINNKVYEFPISSLGVEPIELPIDGKYSKNELVNKMLYEHLVPLETAKKMVPVMQVAIAQTIKNAKLHAANGEKYDTSFIVRLRDMYRGVDWVAGKMTPTQFDEYANKFKLTKGVNIFSFNIKKKDLI